MSPTIEMVEMARLSVIRSMHPLLVLVGPFSKATNLGTGEPKRRTELAFSNVVRHSRTVKMDVGMIGAVSLVGAEGPNPRPSPCKGEEEVLVRGLSRDFGCHRSASVYLGVTPSCYALVMQRRLGGPTRLDFERRTCQDLGGRSRREVTRHPETRLPSASQVTPATTSRPSTCTEMQVGMSSVPEVGEDVPVAAEARIQASRREEPMQPNPNAKSPPGKKSPLVTTIFPSAWSVAPVAPKSLATSRSPFLLHGRSGRAPLFEV